MQELCHWRCRTYCVTWFVELCPLHITIPLYPARSVLCVLWVQDLIHISLFYFVQFVGNLWAGLSVIDGYHATIARSKWHKISAFTSKVRMLVVNTFLCLCRNFNLDIALLTTDLTISSPDKWEFKVRPRYFAVWVGLIVCSSCWIWKFFVLCLFLFVDIISASVLPLCIESLLLTSQWKCGRAVVSCPNLCGSTVLGQNMQSLGGRLEVVIPRWPQSLLIGCHNPGGNFVIHFTADSWSVWIVQCTGV